MHSTGTITIPQPPRSRLELRSPPRSSEGERGLASHHLHLQTIASHAFPFSCPIILPNFWPSPLSDQSSPSQAQSSPVKPSQAKSSHPLPLPVKKSVKKRSSFWLFLTTMERGRPRRQVYPTKIRVTFFQKLSAVCHKRVSSGIYMHETLLIGITI